MGRRIKQLIYGIIYILIIAGIGYGIYYSKNRPTCFDGVKNGKEEGIDCGGKCANVCRIAVPLQVSVIKIIKVDEGDYDILAKVTNTNQEYGSGNVEFEFGNINSSFYILPGQTKRIILNSSSDPSGASFNLKNAEWEKLNSFDPKNIDFRIDRTQLRGGEFEGVIFNNSDFDFDTVDVAVILYDEQDNILAMNKTTVNTLLSRTERYFKVIWPKPVGNAFRAEVEADTNLLENSNFIKRYGSQEKFQEYYPDQR